MKKNTTTKEALIEDIGQLEERVHRHEMNDEQRRAVLSELLDSYEWEENSYGGGRKKKVLVRDWLGIAFLIGELKADADYAMCIQAREELKRENNDLRMRIQELEQPPK